MVHEGKVNAEVSVDYLGRLMMGKTAPVMLIIDGHPVHHAKLVSEFVAAQEGKLLLRFLPPYSPQLNPAESICSNVKRQVARRIAMSQEELRKFVDDAFCRLGALPQIVRSFFRQPECQYIIN